MIWAITLSANGKYFQIKVVTDNGHNFCLAAWLGLVRAVLGFWVCNRRLSLEWGLSFNGFDRERG